MPLLEICLDDLDGATIAEQNGAARIELCTNLAQGGTTPSLGSVATTLASITTVGAQVLVRQRPGDFTYRTSEVDAMVRDVQAIRALPHPAGVTVGFVIGALTDRGQIDVPTMTQLLHACGPAPVTFHRAFDLVADPGESLTTLIDLGVDRVLTAGGPGGAAEGIPTLAALVEQAADRIGILAAGGLRAHNVAEVVRRTGVHEVHLRAQAHSSSSTTSAEVIRAVVAALHGARESAGPEPRPEP